MSLIYLLQKPNVRDNWDNSNKVLKHKKNVHDKYTNTQKLTVISWMVLEIWVSNRFFISDTSSFPFLFKWERSAP